MVGNIGPSTVGYKHSSKFPLLCSAEQRMLCSAEQRNLYRFETIWGWL